MTARKAQAPSHKFRHQFGGTETYKGIAYLDEEGKPLPSETVPDKTMTVRQLLLAHSRNMLPPGLMRQGVFTDMEVPQFDDITEEQAYFENLYKKQDELNAEIEAARRAKKERLDAEYLEKAKARQMPPKPAPEEPEAPAD